MANNVCGQSAAWGGDFERAGLMVAEVEAVKEATGSRMGPYAAISLVGLRVFAKLGIRSRHELSRALPSAEQVPTSAR